MEAATQAIENKLFAKMPFPAGELDVHLAPEDFENISASDIEKYGDVIPNQYILADKVIGRIIKKFEKRKR